MIISSILVLAANGDPASSESRENVRRVLIGLMPTSQEDRDEIDALFVQLNSESYAERRAAQARLMKISVPEEMLEAVRKNASLDFSIRLEEITQVQSEQSVEKRLRSAMFMIVNDEIPSLVEELAGVLEWRGYTEGNQWFLGVDAFRAMAIPGCEDKLRAALSSKDALVRAGALEGLRKILKGPESMIPVLLHLKDEPHPLTAAEVADELAELSHPEALHMYARLLASEDVSVRSRSRDALRHISGQNLGVSIFGEKDELVAYSAKWKDWLKSDVGSSVKFPGVTIPIREDAIPLFNGKDINNWLREKVVQRQFRDLLGVIPQEENHFHRWKIEDGLLVSMGAGVTLSQSIDAINYTLRLDWRFPEGSEGVAQIGVLGLSPDEEESAAFVDIIPGSSGTIGIWGDKLTMHDKNGDEVEFRKIPDAKSKDKRRDWNTLELEVRGNRLNTRINGHASNSVELRPEIDSGSHLIIKPGTTPIEFRNILLQKD